MQKRKEVLKTFIKYCILFLWSMTTIIPIVWVLINSFKNSSEILKNSVSLPSAFDLSNYITVMSYPDINILKAFFNSLIISGGTLIGVLFVAGLASFALGRFESKATKYIMAILIASLLVPTFATMIPNFVMISKLPIRGTYIAVILPQIAGNLCFSIIMLTGFIRSVPIELDEAAIIDGASIFQILRYITLPLSIPMISTVSIMIFIWSYNDLLTPLVYLPTRGLQPICVILSMVSNMFGTDYGAMMAAIILTMIPLLLLYMVSQEQVVKGLTAGAVKG